MKLDLTLLVGPCYLKYKFGGPTPGVASPLSETFGGNPLACLRLLTNAERFHTAPLQVAKSAQERKKAADGFKAWIEVEGLLLVPRGKQHTVKD